MNPLEALLKAEKASESPSHRWRPTSLVSSYVSLDLLRGAQAKFVAFGSVLPLLAAKNFTSLSKLVVAHHRMKLRLKQAVFYRESDQFLFFRSLSFFYRDYADAVEALYQGVLRGEIP